VGTGPVDGGPGDVPRPRSPYGHGHRSGSHRAHPQRLRGEAGRVHPRRVADRQPGHDLRRVRRHRGRLRVVRSVEVSVRSAQRHLRDPARRAGDVPRRRAGADGAVRCVRELHRCRDPRPSRLECGRPGSGRAVDAARPDGGRPGHGDDRDDPGALGAHVHPVVCRRQAPHRRRAPRRAGRRGRRVAPDRRHRLLRGRRVRGDTARRRHRHR
jgi:hypothetical protein